MSMPEQLTITLVAEGEGPPAPLRFKRCLKWLLRHFGLRCRDIREPSAWSEEKELAFAAAVEAMREAVDRGDPWSALMDPRVIAFDSLTSEPAAGRTDEPS